MTYKIKILTILLALLLPKFALANDKIKNRFEVSGIIGGSQENSQQSNGVALIRDIKNKTMLVVAVGKQVKGVRGLTLSKIDGKQVFVTLRSKSFALDWQAKPSSSQPLRSPAIAYKTSPVTPKINDKPNPEGEYGLTPKLEQYLRSLEDGTAEPDDELEQKLLDEWFEVDPELLENFKPENNEYKEYRGNSNEIQKKLGDLYPPSKKL